MQIDASKEQGRAAQKMPAIFAIIIILLALVVPADVFGMNFMFTVHMIQHLLLSLAAPPLLLLGISSWRFRQFFAHHTRVERVITILTIPFLASALFNATLWIWHAPPMLYAMMSNEGLHIGVNILYLATGLLFWWPLLNPTGEEKRALSLGGKLAYLFFSDMPMMLLGAGMTFSPPLYTIAMTNPSMNMAVTQLDQQLGGLLMWVVGSIFFIVLASIFFLRWMLQQEKVAQAKEIYEEEELDDPDYAPVATDTFSSGQ
jgi:putative membrane protein